MASPTLAVLNIQQSGTTPVGFVEQTWTVNGTPTQVYVQGGILVDAVTGTPAVIDANGLHVVPVLGSPNASGLITNGNVPAGGTVTLTSPVPVTVGTTGTLQHAIFSSTLPTLWTVQTVNNAGTPTNVANFLTDANGSFDFKPGMPREISTVQATNTSCVFQVTAQNLSTNQSVAGAVYANFFWAEN